MPLLGIEHTWHAATARRRMGWASAALSPGDIVIMDNLGSHKSPAVRKAIREAGAKLKILLRKAAERTVEATWKRIGRSCPAAWCRSGILSSLGCVIRLPFMAS